jgi:hypothetical protein
MCPALSVIYFKTNDTTLLGWSPGARAGAGPRRSRCSRKSVWTRGTCPAKPPAAFAHTAAKPETSHVRQVLGRLLEGLLLDPRVFDLGHQGRTVARCAQGQAFIQEGKKSSDNGGTGPPHGGRGSCHAGSSTPGLPVEPAESPLPGAVLDRSDKQVPRRFGPPGPGRHARPSASGPTRPSPHKHALPARRTSPNHSAHRSHTFAQRPSRPTPGTGLACDPRRAKGKQSTSPKPRFVSACGKTIND